MTPAARQGTLFLSPKFGSADSEFGPQRVNGSDEPMPNVQTPKRTGTDLDPPSLQRARTTSRDARKEGETKIRARHGFVG